MHTPWTRGAVLERVHANGIFYVSLHPATMALRRLCQALVTEGVLRTGGRRGASLVFYPTISGA